MSSFLDSTGLSYLIGKIKTKLDNYVTKSSIDSNPAFSSTNPVSSGGVYAALENKANFSHSHGNITSNGALQTSDLTIASGDKLVVTDSSDNNRVARTSVAFDGSTTSSVLTKKGTFESLKTINNESIVGSGNITISGGGGDKVNVIEVQNTASFLAEVGNYYIFTTPVTSLTIEIDDISDASHLTGFMIRMTTGANTPTITFSTTDYSSVYAQDGFSFESDTTYELNIICDGHNWFLSASKIDMTNIATNNAPGY